MPGVPSGRGCDGCRRQKKKCDQKKPRCSRCDRLDLSCVGAGVQRFKFKSHHDTQLVLTRPKPRASSSSEGSGRTESLSPVPTNALDRLLDEIVHVTSLRTSLRYNFVYAYGGFLLMVPRHLGINEALDASAEAVINAYTHFCRGGKVAAPDTLMLYSRGLKALRSCLDDPVKACATETLCAIMLLMICQNFIGTQGTLWTVHCEGAAQILKARGPQPPRCELEAALLLSLQGPVVFEALINENIRMSPREWELLIQNQFNHAASFEGQFMHTLSYAPGFIRRGRDVLEEGIFDPTLVTEIDIQYRRMKGILNGLQSRLMTVKAPLVDDELDLTQKRFFHGVYQRGYALGLFVAIVLNCVLTALNVNAPQMNIESMQYSKEIIKIAREAHIYRPLGAAYNILCLLAAFGGATDVATRLEVVVLMEDYHRDFGWEMEPKRFKELQQAAGKLITCEPNAPSTAMLKLKDLFAAYC